MKGAHGVLIPEVTTHIYASVAETKPLVSVFSMPRPCARPSEQTAHDEYTEAMSESDAWGNNVYYAWLRTVSATGVAPLARGDGPLA